MPYDKIDQLYDALKKDGAVNKSRENFRSKMLAPGKEGYQNRLQLYNALKADGAVDSPTYEEFRNRLGLHAVNAVSPNKSGGTNGAGGHPMSAAQKQLMLGSVRGLVANTKAGVAGTRNRIANQMAMVKKPFNTSVRIGENKNVREKGYRYNDNSGKLEKTYVTTLGNEYDSRYNADQEQKQIDQLNHDSSLGGQLENAYAERDRLDEALKKRRQEVDQGEGKLARFLRGLAANSSSGNGALAYNAQEMRYNDDPEYLQLMAAARKNHQTIQLLEDKKNNKMNEFWHNVGNTMLNGYTFSDGLSEMQDAIALQDAAKHIDSINNKRAKGEKLTREEQNAEAVLKNFATDDAMQGLYGDDYGAWGRAGKMFATSIDYGKDFVLNPGGGALAKGVSKGFVKGATEGLTKLAGKQAEKLLAKKAMQYTLKATGIGIGAHLGGLAIANTTAIGKTVGQLGTATGGHVVTDDKGSYHVVDKQKLLPALAEVERSQAREYGSEMIGEFLPGGKVLKKGITKGLEKIGLSKVASTFTNIGTKQWYKQYSNLLKAGGYNGIPGEVMEEYEGSLFDALTGHADDAWRDMTSLRNHVDIWLGCGTMGAIMGAVPMMGAVNHTANYYGYKHKTDKADKVASSLLGDEKWGAIRDKIDQTENGKMADVLVGILTDKELNDQAKSATLDYVRNLTKMRGYNIANVNCAAEESMEATPTDQHEGEAAQQQQGIQSGAKIIAERMNASYGMGYNATDAPAMYDANVTLKAQENRLSKLLGVDDVRKAMGDDPMAFVEKRKQAGASAEELQAMEDYLVADSAVKGIRQRMADNLDSRLSESDAEMEKRINTDDGMVHKAVMQVRNQDGMEHEVYVLKGNVKMNADGRGVDASSSDNEIYVYDPQEGKTRMMPPSFIERIDEPVDAETVRRAAGESIRQDYQSELAKLDTSGLSFQVGDRYDTVDENGVQHRIEVVGGAVDAAGNAMNGYVGVRVDDGEAVSMRTDEISKMVGNADVQKREAELNGEVSEDGYASDAEDTSDVDHAVDAEDVPTYAQNEVLTLLDEHGNPVRAEIMAAANEDGLYEVQTDEPIDGKRVSMMSAEEIAAKSPTAPLNPPSRGENEPTKDLQGGEEEATLEDGESGDEKSALSRIPMDEETQEPRYEEVDADTAWDAIVEQTNGDRALAQEVVDDTVNEMSSDIEKAEKSISKATFKGNGIQERIAFAKEKQERMAALEFEKERLAKWKRIASVERMRAAAVEAEKSKAAAAERKARQEEEEKARQAREEAERKEREALNGVPNMTEDKPSDARARGYRRVDGHKVDRQAPVNAVMGKEVQVKFDDKNIPAGHVAVVDASELQPSHIGGQRNAKHFIDEAQPKERKDNASVEAARKIASNIRPEEITTSVTAYTGAPTVNSRGEVIQGNNRSAALKEMWASHPEQGAQYKQYLKGHAAEYGLTAEDIDKVQSPVLVNMLDVSDADAIALGQFVASDTESGGTERLKPKNVTKKLGERMKNFSNILLRSSDEESSFSEPLDRNGVETLKWLNGIGAITPTQYKSSFDSKGNLTAEAKNDLKGVLYQYVFEGGSTQLEEMFNGLPAKAQRAILSTAYRDYESAQDERMIEEIQNSIMAYHALSQDAQFMSATNHKDARTAVESWKRQYAIDDVTGESYLPSEKFSNFALLLAVMYKGDTQSYIQAKFNAMYDLIQGVREDTLFGTPDNTPRTLAEAIKEELNIDYDGQQRSDVLAGSSQVSQARETGSQAGAERGERVEAGEQPTDSGARTEGDTGKQVAHKDNTLFQYFTGSLADMIARAKLSATDFAKKVLAPVSPRLKEDLQAHGVKLDGDFNHVIDNAAIRHTLKQHGGKNEEKRGQIPITDADFGRIPDVVENYDEITVVDGKRGDVNIIYSKTYEDGTTVFVEEKREKRKELAAVTMWKKQSPTLTDANRENTTPISDLSETSSGGKDTNNLDTKQENEEKVVSQAGEPLSGKIKSASEDVDTAPTEAQKEAGNYKKGHVQVGKFDITIEQPQGSIRKGTDANGKAWESKMHNTYGYIRGTVGVDGDHIDVFLSNNIDGWDGRKVYVVDQYNPDGSFDEHKVMLGFNDINEAKSDYLANYEKGWEKGRRIDVSAMDLEDFEKWIASSKRKTKPFGEYKNVKYESAVSPKSGAFGTIYTQFKGKPQEAIAFLLEKKEGEAIGALHHKDIGDIDLVWGKEGTDKSDGFGLAKLAKYHPEVLGNLQDIFDTLVVVKRTENRVQLESETHQASVRLTWDSEKKNWLLTAFEKKNSVSDNTTDTVGTAESGKRNDTATPQNTVSDDKYTNNDSSEQANSVKSFKITPQEYITKRGKKLAMQLVTFESELSKEQMNAAKQLAKEAKGWWSEKDGGFLMRDMESAQKLADIVLEDADAVADAQPLSLQDLSAVNDQPTVQAIDDAEDTMSMEQKPTSEQPTMQQAKEGTQQEEKKAKSKWVDDADAARFEELRQRLHKKLNGQLNMGIDPEAFSIGVEMSYLMLKHGARKFGDFAKQMVEALGENVRPYLKSFYNGARDLPEMADYENEMTPYDEVRSFDVMNFDKEGAKDIFATAEHVAREQAVEREAKEATKKLKEQRNEQRDKKEQENEKSKKKSLSSQEKNIPNLLSGLFGDDELKPTSNEQEVHVQARPGTSEREGGHQREQNESLGASQQHEDERADAERVVGRSGKNTMSDASGGSRLSELSDGKLDVKPSESEPAPLADSALKNTHNNHAARGIDYAPKSTNARIDANIKAIETMQRLIESGNPATPEDMSVLRKFSGWGGLGEAFSEMIGGPYGSINHSNKRLRELLSPETYEAANMSRNSAYYTPAPVIDAMWDVARAMGFRGGNVLEGSAGIGNIIGLMPTDMSERSDIHAVEIDETTGNILSLLYPDANVEVKGFEKTFVPNGSVDLAITNVPFVTGLRVMDETGDKDLSRKFHDIHDFCIAKNVRKLKEGGIGIFISSSGTLDSPNSAKLRTWVVNDGGADVVGAFRMHNQTFGGTGATSDIIVIRKRVNGKKSVNTIDVSGTLPIRTVKYNTGETKRGSNEVIVKDLALDVNKHFVEHPEDMAGEMAFAFEKGDTYRATSKGLYPSKSINQEQRLAEWAQQFKDMDWDKAEEPKTQQVVYEDLGADVKEGSMLLDSDGNLCLAQRGKAVPLDVNANKVKGRTKAACFNDYKAIKDALAAVLEYQTTHSDDVGLKQKLDALNKVYDAFVKTYGHLNKNTSISFLRNDMDYPSIAALESVSETGDKNGKRIVSYGKTDIFSRRVVETESEPKPTTVKDGIIASLYLNGRVDVPYIAKQLGKSESEVRGQIIKSGLGFENPTTTEMEVSYEYLSGNVREKLRQAQENNTDGRYDTNIKALERVIPMNIPAHLIEFTLGSSWVDPKLYEDFVKERTGIEVKLTNTGGTWLMSEPYWTNTEQNKAMGVISEKCDKTILGHELIKAAITCKSISVTKSVTTGYGSNRTTETIVDKEATVACANKIDEIRQDFKDWAHGKMQGDAELSERMERVYNELFNNSVPKEIPDEFVPAHFGGAATIVEGHPFQLRPHQAKAVVRATTQPLMLAHEVGTGKTYTLISTAMEMRRLGTARKPMIVVQNATVGQFVASAKALYPNAKILTLEDADRNADGRRNFYAKIRYNDWDMIVVPQSVFERIPDSEERQMRFIEDKVEEKMMVLEKMREAADNDRDPVLRQAERELDQLNDELNNLKLALQERKSGGKSKKDEKREAKSKQNAAVKAQEMLDRETDDVANFDDMGVDALLIDEAHEYKHLGFATAMQRGVKGVDPSYSKKSQGVYLKTQAVLENKNGKNVVFATGTPISNTAAEIWTFMRYLMPADTMREYGIYYFDDFVRNFGNIQQMLEFSTSGKYKEDNRFAGYVNLPELVRIWSGIADTVLTREAGGVSDKIPQMDGGQAQDIYLPQTKALRGVMKYVKEQLNAYENMSGKEKKENSHIPLVMYGIAKAAAVDARLVLEDAVDEPNSKTNEAVRQTLRSLEDTKDYNGTVAIFADNYQNKSTGFNLYEDIRKKLIESGVPKDEIVVMKSGMKVKKKLEIFDKVNRGEVRVIMGSTFTLGTGVNIQERLHTLIHMDAPNRPMDYTQRNGRILRQGNLHNEWGLPVRVLRFGVEDSLDVTAYQRLKTKGAIADSIMEGKKMMNNSMENRVLEEDQDLFGDITAQLSGSQYALLKNQVEKEVRKLEARKKQWEADQTYVHNQKPRLEGLIKDGKERAERNREALAKVEGAKQEGIVIGKQKFATLDAMANYIKDYNSKQREQQEQVRKASGYNAEAKSSLTVNIGGFDFHVNRVIAKEQKQEKGQLSISFFSKTQMTYSCPELGLEGVPVDGQRLKSALEDIVNNVMSGNDFRERIEHAERAAERYKGELQQVESREGKPFEYADELSQAKEKLSEYEELMKAEMAEKEAKYAEMDSEVDAAKNVRLTEEEDAEDDLYRGGDDYERDELDKRYMAAVKRGDMATAQRMVNEAARRSGYFPGSNYQGTSAFNGSAPYGNGYFITPEERKEAFENDEFDGDTTLADYVTGGIDPMNLDFLLSENNYRHSDAARKEAIDNIREVVRTKGQRVTMYRSVPSSVKEGSFRNGDWVTPSRKYAEENARVHGWGNAYHIIAQDVPISDVWFDGNDIAEWGYGSEADFMNDKDYLYGNTKNNRKLPDAVTYDDNGDVIPLSKRFNAMSGDLRFRVDKNFENPKVSDENVLREKHGANGDEDISLSHDPMSKLLGESAYTDAQRKAFVERERKRMAGHVSELSKKLNLKNVDVVTDASTLSGDRRRAKGFFNKKTGKITIVIPNHMDMADVEKTLLHEAVAHYGLRKLFGDNFDNFLDNVYRNAEYDIRERISEMSSNHGWDVRTATEEYLAGLAEDTNFENMPDGFWSKIKHFFLQMLHSIGFKNLTDVSMGNNELRYVLWRSYENLKEPGRYRNFFAEAADVAKQYQLKVGPYEMDANKNMDDFQGAAESDFKTKKKGISQRVMEIENTLLPTSVTYSGESLSSSEKIPTFFENSKFEENYSESDGANKADGADRADTEVVRRKTGFGDTKFSDGKREQQTANERFNNEFTRYQNGEMNKNEMLHLGRPQGVMRTFLPNLPIVMRQRILTKGSVRKHNVAIEALADMPNHLSHPIFVFKRSDNALGVLTEMQDRDGKNVCVAIELNRQIQDGGEILEVNDIRSVHGRNVADIVYPIIRNGTLKWADKEKGLAYLSSASQYVQQEIDKQNLNTATKVVKDFVNPKVSDENVADKTDTGDELYRSGEDRTVERVPDIVVSQLYEDAVKDTRDRTLLGALVRTWSKDGRTRFKNKFAESYFDYSRSVKALQDAIAEATGRKVEWFEDVWKSLNAKSSIDEREQEAMTRTLAIPLSRHISSMVSQSGGKYDLDAIEAYLNAKHGLERNELMARRAAEEAAEEAYGAEMEQCRKALAADALDTTAEERLQVLTSQYDAMLEESYAANRRDYAGLTALFDPEKEGKSLAELEDAAREYISEIEGYYDADAIGVLWDKVRALNNFSLKKSYESGLLSKKQYDDISKMYKWYVPLRGWHDNYAGDVYNYVNRGADRGMIENAVKKAYGRTSRAGNILGTMSAMANSAIVVGNKNKVAQVFMNLALNHEYTGLFTISEAWYEKNEADDSWHIVTPDNRIHEGMTAEEVADTITKWEDEMREKAANGKALMRSGKFSKDFRHNLEAWKAQQHCVRVSRGGKEYLVYVNGNPRATQAINGLLNPDYQPGIAENILQKYMRHLARVQTSWSPKFVMSNLQRDMLTATGSAYAKHGAGYALEFEKNFAMNTKDIFGLFYKDLHGSLDMRNDKERMFKEFLDNGGKTGISAIGKKQEYEEKYNKSIRRAMHPASSAAMQGAEGIVQGVEFMNSCIENLTRFSTYMTSRQMGKSIKDAIFDAKECSVNFNMKGSGAWGNATLRKYILYTNPALQALRMLNSWYDANNVRTVSMLASGVAMGFMVAMVNAMCNGGDGDDNAYYGLSDYNRHTYFNIGIGNRKFLHWRLPQEMSPLYALGHISYDLMTERISTERAIQMSLEQLNNYSPLSLIEGNPNYDQSADNTYAKTFLKAITPSYLSPFTDAFLWDEDFLGRSIGNRNEWNKRKPEWQRVDKRTPEWFIKPFEAIGKATGSNGSDRKGLTNSPVFNPSAWWFVLMQQGGGLAQVGEQAFNACAVVLGSKDADDMELKDYPFVSTVLVDAGTDNARMRIKNERFWMYRSEHEANKATISNITHSRDLSPVEKAEKISSMQDSRYALMDYFMKKYYKPLREGIAEAEANKDNAETKRLKGMLNEVKGMLLERIDKAEGASPDLPEGEGKIQTEG